MSTGTHDVIVVGAGPAGATAAQVLGARGRDVLVVDKATFPRDKLCGGLVTWKTTALLDRVFGASLSRMQEDGTLDYSTREYEVFFDGDTVKRGHAARPYHFANRRQYDAHLFETATSHPSVEARTGTGVVGVDPEEGAVTLETGETITASYVVGADGVHSRVRQAMESTGRLKTTDWSQNLAIATEAYIPREEIDLSTDRLLVHLGFVDWGYGWVFPNTDRLVIGVGGLNRKNDTSFRTLLDDYYDRLGVDADASEAKGHPIPFGNYLTDPTAGDALLVGDAAGFVHAMSGEGIFYGQRSGELCGYAIDEALSRGSDPAPLYRAYLDDHVLSELRLSKLVRPLLWGGPNALRRPIVHTWGAALHQQWEELVHGTRLYRFLSRSGDRFHTAIP